MQQLPPEPALLVSISPRHRQELRRRFPNENEQDIVGAIIEWMVNRPDLVDEVREIHEVLQTLKALR